LKNIKILDLILIEFDRKANYNQRVKELKDALKDKLKSIKDEEIKKNESIFGTSEWNKKYSIKKEEEIVEEPSLNEMVNETLKTKTDDVMSFTEMINDSRNISNPNVLETKKK